MSGLGFEIRNGVIYGHSEWAGCPAWVPFFFDYADNNAADAVEVNLFHEFVYVFNIHEFLAAEWPEVSAFKVIKIWREKRTGLPKFIGVAR